MSSKVSVEDVRDRLPEMLDQVVKTGEEYVVQRDGKDCAVLVNVRQWRRRAVGQRLDALGPSFRLSRPKQARAEALIAATLQRSLTAPTRREHRALLKECDTIMR